MRCLATVAVASLLGCASTTRQQARHAMAKGTEAEPRLAMATSGEPGVGDLSATRPAASAAEYGIEVVAIRRSAAGYMLDLRYRIVDPERARAFLDRSRRPYLIDEATGAEFRIPSSPKIGALRQVPQTPDPERTYFMFFANPQRFIQPGNHVTVVADDCRLEGIVVE
jgi:hypothetical protein